MGTFLDAFRPSEDVKCKRRIFELEFYIKSIKHKSCASCEHCVTEKDWENGMYETTISHCAIHNDCRNRTNCKYYKVGNLEVVKHQNERV